MIAAQLIGGAVIPPASTGIIDLSLIVTTIASAFPQGIEATLSLPTVAVAMTASQVAVLGTVIGTITFVQGY